MYGKRYKLNEKLDSEKPIKTNTYDEILEFITVKTPNGIKDFFSKLDSKVSFLFKSNKKQDSSKDESNDSLSDIINKFANKR